MVLLNYRIDRSFDGTQQTEKILDRGDTVAKTIAANWILVANTILLFASQFSTPLSCLAADGDRDPDFGAAFTCTGIQCDGEDRFKMLLQSDGKIVLACIEEWTALHLCWCGSIAQAKLDLTYSGDGVASINDGGLGQADLDLIIQPDDKAVIADVNAANHEGFVSRRKLVATSGGSSNVFYISFSAYLTGRAT